MNAYDILGYVVDGCILCKDCFVKPNYQGKETSPYFVCDDDSTDGCITCCDMCFSPLEV